MNLTSEDCGERLLLLARAPRSYDFGARQSDQENDEKKHGRFHCVSIDTICSCNDRINSRYFNGMELHPGF